MAETAPAPDDPWIAAGFTPASLPADVAPAAAAERGFNRARRHHAVDQRSSARNLSRRVTNGLAGRCSANGLTTTEKSTKPRSDPPGR